MASASATDGAQSRLDGGSLALKIVGIQHAARARAGDLRCHRIRLMPHNDNDLGDSTIEQRAYLVLNECSAAPRQQRAWAAPSGVTRLRL